MGRVVGLAFFLPFIVFCCNAKFQNPPHSLALFALGGLQGFMGWYMVQSGLTDRVDVSQYRLAMHLGLALIIFSFCLWMGLHFSVMRASPLPVPVLHSWHNRCFGAGAIASGRAGCRT